ncbi:MAG: hypothetical protein JWN60_228 [Acidobacteria bacterium]|jgi:hypothetical protein|nr:hypothetical protein [Acidobacteriota bacterium]
MSGKIFRFLILFVFFSGFILTSRQSSAAQTTQNKSFSVGETLVYEGKFSKIIKGIAVVDLSFSVLQADDKNNFLIKSEARSKGSLLKLFRYSFLQQINSTVDAQKFQVLKTVKRDVQDKRVRDSEAVFNYGESRVTYVETDPNDPMRPPRRIASEIKANVQDMVSGIYSLRLLPLAVGKSFEVSISDSGLVYKIPVRVTARELQKTIYGKIWCFRVEPEVFGTNRLIEKEGSLIIWITDDARRLPVRAQINSDIGRVEVKLKKAAGVKGI